MFSLTFVLQVVWTLWKWAALTPNDDDNLKKLTFTDDVASFDSTDFGTLNGNDTDICPTLRSIYIGVTSTDDSATAFDFDAKFTELETPEDDLCTGIWLWLGKIFLYSELTSFCNGHTSHQTLS